MAGGGGGVHPRILDRGVPRRFVNPNNRSLTENTQTNISSYGLRLDFRFSLSACGLIPRAATGNRAHSGLAFHADFRSTPKRRREENCPVKARSV